MRILFVHNVSDLYGASRSLLRLTTRLVRDGHDVMAILRQPGPLFDALRAAGVQAELDSSLVIMTRKGIVDHRGYLEQAADLPRSLATLRRAIKRFRPQLVHTNTAVIISSPIAAALARIPHIWHMREFFVDFPRLWPLHRRFMTSAADRVLCVSAAVAAQFQAAATNVEVLHNGFPTEEFAPVAPSRSKAIRDRFGLGNDLAVGIIGRIKFKRKGQETFVRAAALLAKSHPNVRFLVIGSPFPGTEDHQARLEQLIAELGIADRVTLTGDIEDIKAAYAALDITVLASATPEPFGGVVIEAMALGRPVIGTRLGGTPEQIEDGVTGFLVAPDHPEQMARAMETLLEDDVRRKAMGAAARERFERKFEFEPFYERLRTIYEDVLRST